MNAHISKNPILYVYLFDSNQTNYDKDTYIV